MKKHIALVLTLALVLSACPITQASEVNTPDFKGMNDPRLLPYIEDICYEKLVSTLDSEEFFVENIQSVYISQEYLDELAYNSEANIFFGYTLSKLDAQFQSEKYVFTLGENYETVVEPWESYDAVFNRIIKNIAIGTGVILVFVTVSIFTKGVGTPSVVSIIHCFATAGAKDAAKLALIAGSIGGLSGGAVTGIQTGDMDKAIESAAILGSEGFKFGAIAGTIKAGGFKTKTLIEATLKGLTMKEAAAIQNESHYPIDVIKNLNSMKEYEVLKEAGLKPQIVNKETALVRSIDLDFVDMASKDKLTNLERMKRGWAALDPSTGMPYELHHMGQEMNSTLAIVTREEHNLIPRMLEKSKIDRIAFRSQREEFWIDLAEQLTKGVK